MEESQQPEIDELQSWNDLKNRLRQLILNWPNKKDNILKKKFEERGISKGFLSSTLVFEIFIELGFDISEEDIQILQNKFGNYKLDINCKSLLTSLSTDAPKDYTNPELLIPRLPQPYRMIDVLLNKYIIDVAWDQISIKINKSATNLNENKLGVSVPCSSSYYPYTVKEMVTNLDGTYVVVVNDKGDVCLHKSHGDVPIAILSKESDPSRSQNGKVITISNVSRNDAKEDSLYIHKVLGLEVPLAVAVISEAPRSSRPEITDTSIPIHIIQIYQIWSNAPYFTQCATINIEPNKSVISAQLSEDTNFLAIIYKDGSIEVFKLNIKLPLPLVIDPIIPFDEMQMRNSIKSISISDVALKLGPSASNAQQKLSIYFTIEKVTGERHLSEFYDKTVGLILVKSGDFSFYKYDLSRPNNNNNNNNTDSNSNTTAVSNASTGKAPPVASPEKKKDAKDGKGGAKGAPPPTAPVDTNATLSTNNEVKPSKTWYLFSPVTSSAMDSSTLLLALGLADGSVLVWDVKLGVEFAVVQKHISSVTQVAFFQQQYLVSGSIDGRVHFYTLSLGSSNLLGWFELKNEIKKINIFNTLPIAIVTLEDLSFRVLDISACFVIGHLIPTVKQISNKLIDRGAKRKEEGEVEAKWKNFPLLLIAGESILLTYEGDANSKLDGSSLLSYAAQDYICCMYLGIQKTVEKYSNSIVNKARTIADLVIRTTHQQRLDPGCDLSMLMEMTGGPVMPHGSFASTSLASKSNNNNNIENKILNVNIKSQNGRNMSISSTNSAAGRLARINGEKGFAALTSLPGAPLVRTPLLRTPSVSCPSYYAVKHLKSRNEDRNDREKRNANFMSMLSSAVNK